MESNRQQEILVQLEELEMELITRLNMKLSYRHPNIQQYIEAELLDVKSAINKVKQGNFGYCEISGELIPFESISQIPIIKTIKDIKHLNQFKRKSLFH